LNSAIQSLVVHDSLKIRKESSGHSITFTVVDEQVDDLSTSQGVLTKLTQSEIDVSVRGTVAADIKPPTFSFNPLVTAWELLPFSFILDWFIGIGQWLASMSFLTFAEKWAAAGGFKVTIDRTIETTIDFAPDYSGERYLFSLARSELVTRTPTSVSLTPQIRVNLDEFKYLDLVSLIFGLRR
jgi:hypothetical protein